MVALSGAEASRRSFLKAAGALGLTGGCGGLSPRPGPPAIESRLFDLRAIIKDRVQIESVQLLGSRGEFLVRARSKDGVTGFAIPNQHVAYVAALFNQRVAPYFAGKDARDIEALIDGVHVHDSNYKLVGIPFWAAVSWAELSLLDLLGRIAGKPVGALLGGEPLRNQVDMYLSSTDRTTTPEQEVARFEAALAATGARAIKFKVGGRMSRNADASPGRSEAMVKLARKRLGDRITLYADANGSFDVDRGIEMGRMLEDHAVAIYEEPCPFEDLEATRRVTHALRRIVVAGGEQDTSWYRFRELVTTRALDMVQPDLSYNGGFVRTTRVARMAAAAGLSMSPHCPQASTMLYTLHLARYTPNLGPFQEFNVKDVGKTPWFAPDLKLARGTLPIPTAPGLGLTIDPALVDEATVL